MIDTKHDGANVPQGDEAEIQTVQLRLPISMWEAMKLVALRRRVPANIVYREAVATFLQSETTSQQ